MKKKRTKKLSWIVQDTEFFPWENAKEEHFVLNTLYVLLLKGGPTFVKSNRVSWKCLGIRYRRFQNPADITAYTISITVICILNSVIQSRAVVFSIILLDVLKYIHLFPLLSHYPTLKKKIFKEFFKKGLKITTRPYLKIKEKRNGGKEIIKKNKSDETIWKNKVYQGDFFFFLNQA